MEAFLRQTWVDPRLNYEHLSNFSNLELDQRMMGDVWVPDTYFPNEKEAHFHVVTVPNRLLHINRNGTVFYSIRWVSFKGFYFVLSGVCRFTSKGCKQFNFSWCIF